MVQLRGLEIGSISDPARVHSLCLQTADSALVLCPREPEGVAYSLCINVCNIEKESCRKAVSCKGAPYPRERGVYAGAHAAHATRYICTPRYLRKKYIHIQKSQVRVAEGGCKA